ncbi:hypothetical protein J2X85_001148 [Microbacterium trichothecenolyticum]|nr:hypothetical protein [Microbacterium trichothecenolyticum]
MASAQVREVRVVRGSAFGGGNRVVDIAPPYRAAAAGESAVLVPGGEEIG